jgi:alkylation response protein AidB-like acyl-CoA dehydrogenase
VAASVDPAELEHFRAEVTAWIARHRERAPADYGPIVPGDVVDDAVAWQRHLYDEGWAGLHWPEEHGGRGLTPEHQSIWVEECARASVPPFLNMVGFVLAGQGIQVFGTETQRREHLRPIITAERIWCQLFSEPEAGSDLASLRTTAVADGDEWVVTGQKVWSSNARVADRAILMARTDPDASPHKGISFFLLDMHSPGVEVRPLRQMTGASEFDEVFLTDVRLPADALLGPLHDGWRVGMVALTNERGSIGAATITTQRRLDAMRSLAEGGLAATERQRLVGLWSRGRAFAAMARSQGATASVASSLNKLGTTEMVFDVAELRADLAGAEAMLDGPAAAGLLGAPGGRIAGGTSQIQRNIIGERILGLPKEPRPG